MTNTDPTKPATTHTPGQAEADARLRDAAPALLAALHETTRLLDACSRDAERLGQREAAAHLLTVMSANRRVLAKASADFEALWPLDRPARSLIIVRQSSTGTYHWGFANSPGITVCNHSGQRRRMWTRPARPEETQRAVPTSFCRKCFSPDSIRQAKETL